MSMAMVQIKLKMHEIREMTTKLILTPCEVAEFEEVNNMHA